jgi:sugar diacid utilization regulator
MFDGRDEEAILQLVVAATPSLGPFRVAAALRRDEGAGLRQIAGRYGDHILVARLEDLGGEDGPVPVLDGFGWTRALALHGADGNNGYLVLAADSEPTQPDLYLLKALAQQATAAMTMARLRRREREQAESLRSLTCQLQASVATLQRHATIQDTLTDAAAIGGEQAIVEATRELTGFAVVVVDQFGNVRARSSGSGTANERSEEGGSEDRARVLERARREPGPARTAGRLLTVLQPGGRLMGALALVDPRGVAGDEEIFALSHAGTLLATELIHQRELAEVELRMRRDLIEELMTGTTDPGIFTRAEALGHDLRPAHRVVLVGWEGGAAVDRRAGIRAVERAAAGLRLSAMVGWHSGAVVLLTHQPDARLTADHWGGLHRAVSGQLTAAAVSIGVSGLAEHPESFDRSFQEANQALATRRRSRTPDGATAFDELGIHRLLTSRDPYREATNFARDWLGDLLDYDTEHHAELVTTLAIYLDCGGNYDGTSHALNIHRSTLRYRLRRIREISDHDLTDVNTRLNLHLAARTWTILQGTGTAVSAPYASMP